MVRVSQTEQGECLLSFFVVEHVDDSAKLAHGAAKLAYGNLLALQRFCRHIKLARVDGAETRQYRAHIGIHIGWDMVVNGRSAGRRDASVVAGFVTVTRDVNTRTARKQ